MPQPTNAFLSRAQYTRPITSPVHSEPPAHTLLRTVHTLDVLCTLCMAPRTPRFVICVLCRALWRLPSVLFTLRTSLHTMRIAHMRCTSRTAHMHDARCTTHRTHCALLPPPPPRCNHPCVSVSLKTFKTVSSSLFNQTRPVVFPIVLGLLCTCQWPVGTLWCNTLTAFS